MNNWFYASLIVDEDYANDGFLQTFKRLTADDPWRIEDTINLSVRSRKKTIDYKLYSLLEKKSRVIILHSSVALARRVLQVATQNGLTKEGYAWFLTENAITKDEQTLTDYPVGLVALSLDDHTELHDIVTDAVGLIAKATERFIHDNPHKMDAFLVQKNCGIKPTADHLNVSDELYRWVVQFSLTLLLFDLPHRCRHLLHVYYGSIII